MKNYKKFLELQKQVKKYAEGGKVEHPHDKKNLQSLKSSFQKFLKEEESEKYAEGGDVEEQPERKSMEQRIKSDIQLIDPETGEIKKSVPKTYSKTENLEEPKANTLVSDHEENESIPEDKNSERRKRLQNTMGKLNSLGNKSNTQGMPVQASGPVISDKIIEQIGQDIEEHPENQQAIFEHYKNHGIDLTKDDDYSQEIRDRLDSHMDKRGFDSAWGKEKSKFSAGGDVNTSSSLSALLKDTYSRKIPLNIPKGAKLKIPKRLKSISDVNGYSNGEYVEDTDQDSPNRQYWRQAMSSKSPDEHNSELEKSEKEPTKIPVLKPMKNNGKMIGYYSGGGDVKNDNSTLAVFSKYFRKALGTEESEVPKKDTTKEEKYEKIRKENHERMSGERPSQESYDPDYNSQTQYKSDGGDVEDNSLAPTDYEEKLKELESQGIKVGQVQGDEMPVSASKLESQYVPEEASAQNAVDLSVAGQDDVLGQIDQALGKSSDEKPSEGRNLDGMTLSKDEALKENELEEPGKAKLPDEEDASKRARPDSDKELEEAFASSIEKPKKSEEEARKPASIPEEKTPVPSFDPMTALKEAQDQRNSSEMWNQLGAISERGAAAWAGIKPTQQKAYETNIALSQQAVEDVKDRIKHQGDDPNSIISQNFRKYLEKFSGAPVDPNTTANSGKEILPMVFKDYEAQEASKTRKELLDQRLKERSEESHERQAAEEKKYKYLADERRWLEGEKSKDRDASNKLKTEEKQDQFDRKRLDKLGKELTAETASSRSAFGRGANNIRSAEAIQALTDQFKGHLDQMDERQITEVARSLDALLAQGQPTISGTVHLIPKTAVGNVAKIVEYLRNIPTGQQQGLFVKRMLETVDREKELAKDQIKRTQGKIMGPYMETLKRRPDDARDILAPHGLEFLIDSEKKEAKSEESPKKEEKKVIKKGYNAKTNQTQLIYDDGSKEILDGRQ